MSADPRAVAEPSACGAALEVGQRPCPNEALGASDIATGQVWRRYATDPRKTGTYRVLADSRGPSHRLMGLVDGAPEAPTFITASLGDLLAHWHYVGAS